MIAGIFLLAAMLVIAATASLAGAIMLVPTDLGFAYLQASSILIGAGAIVMAIGFAARLLDRRLAALSLAGRARPAFPDTPDDTLVEPAASATEPVVPSSAAAGAATAAIAAAGATLAATSLLRDRDGEPAPDEAPIAAIAADLPESDPFHDILKDAKEDVVIPEPMMPEPMMPETREKDDKAEAALELPPTDLPLPINLDAIRVAVDDAASEVFAAVNADEGETVDTSAMSDRLAAVGPAPEKNTEVPPGEERPGEKRPGEKMAAKIPDASPSPTSGLIADDDLAAIADGKTPPLAPLETLMAVGSYDSGGTRFTMYSDGSVVAQGPEGEQRFRTLEELRRHIGGT